MYIAWGREFIQFYNDAYRPILGSTKHPSALGQSSYECFAEIWDLIEPMFEQAIAQGKATSQEDQRLPLNRNGYPEECYFSFSYSAIPDQNGTVGGVLVTGIETTERVLGDRRLKTLTLGAMPCVEQAQRWLPHNGDRESFALEQIVQSFASESRKVKSEQLATLPAHILLADDNADAIIFNNS